MLTSNPPICQPTYKLLKVHKLSCHIKCLIHKGHYKKQSEGKSLIPTHDVTIKNIISCVYLFL